MKKVIIAILAIVYMGTSTGATIHMHYCMGELADWKLKQKESDKCGNCGVEKESSDNGGFCKVEKKFLKYDSDQKATNSLFKRIQISAVAIPSSFITFSDVDLSSVTEENPISHAPPHRNEAIAVYIINCVFLI